MKLSSDEKALLDSVENDEWQSVQNADSEAKRYQSYAEATVRKDKRINIRLSERDLLKLPQIALEI